MNGFNLLSGTPPQDLQGLGDLGKFCIFGCKAQKKADKAKATAVAADKLQAITIASMKANNESTVQANAQLIAEKEAEVKKKTMIILGVGGGVILLLGIAYAVKRSNKK